jgi:hypothetical protein
VGDYTNSRVLVFNVAPGFTKGEAASYVLGQTSFTGHAAGCSQTALSGLGPSGYDPNNNLLYVSAFGNARVLVFNVPLSVTNGTSYGENAIFELGQTSGPSAFSICNPPSLQLRPANRLKIALGVSDACWVYPWWSVLTQEVVRRNT